MTSSSSLRIIERSFEHLCLYSLRLLDKIVHFVQLSAVILKVLKNFVFQSSKSRKFRVQKFRVEQIDDSNLSYQKFSDRKFRFFDRFDFLVFNFLEFSLFFISSFLCLKLEKNIDFPTWLLNNCFVTFQYLAQYKYSFSPSPAPSFKVVMSHVMEVRSYEVM